MRDRTNGEICKWCKRKRRGLWKFGKLWRFCDRCDMMGSLGVGGSSPIVPPDAPLAQEEES